MSLGADSCSEMPYHNAKAFVVLYQKPLCSSCPFLCLAFDTQLGSHGTLGCGGGGLRPLPSTGNPRISGSPRMDHQIAPHVTISEVSIRCIALSIHSGEAWHQPSTI